MLIQIICVNYSLNVKMTKSNKTYDFVFSLNSPHQKDFCV